RLYLHGESLRAHNAHQKVQGHENTHQRFRPDRRYPRRAYGLLSIPASAELPLLAAAPQIDLESTRSGAPERCRIPAQELVERNRLQGFQGIRRDLLLMQRP